MKELNIRSFMIVAVVFSLSKNKKRVKSPINEKDGES